MAEGTGTTTPTKSGIAVTGVTIGHTGVNQYGKTWENGVNSAGGASVKLSVMNTDSSKTIKYAQFYFTPYNQVGDAVGDSISRSSTKGCQLVGPVGPGQTKNDVFWENLWYNNSIVRAKVDHIIIQYMDGSEKTVQASELDPWPAGTASTNSGCYVATAVYGSYDCPQVWTLRRFRDYELAETRRGRAFIKTYYAISPTLVKWFGDTKWFKRLWRGRLDSLVRRCQGKGYASTPYDDRVW